MCPPCLESVSPAPRVRRPNSSSAKRSSCTLEGSPKDGLPIPQPDPVDIAPKRDPSSIGIGITYRKAALRCRIVRDMPLIEVYADIWCPFTHVGLRSVVRRRDQAGRDDVTLRVLSWPLELVNGKPLDPMMTASHVDDLRTQVAPDLFTGFDPKHFPRTTLPALAVAAAAYRQGGRVGEAVSLALREALFEKGQDISHPGVLADVASAHGVAGVDAEDDAVVQREGTKASRGVSRDRHTSSARTSTSFVLRSTFPQAKKVTFASAEMSSYSTPFSRIASGTRNRDEGGGDDRQCPVGHVTLRAALTKSDHPQRSGPRVPLRSALWAQALTDSTSYPGQTNFRGPR